MKNKTSPIKFLGAATATAAGALGTSLMGGALGGLFGRRNIRNRGGSGGETSADQYSGIGSGMSGDPVIDAGMSAQFNPAAMQNMQGIFGNTNARQASLGASGMFALKKHLSPLNQGEELNAYSDDTSTPAYDDGAGGTDYEAKAKDEKTLENLKFTTDKNSLDLTGKYDPNWNPTMEEDGYTLEA